MAWPGMVGGPRPFIDQAQPEIERIYFVTLELHQVERADAQDEPERDEACREERPLVCCSEAAVHPARASLSNHHPTHDPTMPNQRDPPRNGTAPTNPCRVCIPHLALALSGGGARAAYQVGVLRYVAQRCPGVVPDILTGVSAGGVNAAFLAAQQATFAEKVERLAAMWSSLAMNDVFRVDLRDLTSRTVRWGGRLLSAGTSPLPPAKSLVDNAPLRILLERVLEARNGCLEGIARSLASGWLARSNDMLSLVMFQADYVRRLIEIGEADAAARGDEIASFLMPGDRRRRASSRRKIH
jgi:Patatin-like phospholipase